MTPREELQALLERVEKAEGASIELFYAVARGILPDHFPSVIDHDQERAEWKVLTFGKFVSCGAWTDAALALVERKLPGWELEITSEHRDGAVTWRAGLGDPMMGWDGEANTLALAIIAAFLSALIASPASPADRQGTGPGKPENETPRERAG